ncbi:MAG: phosphopyruvate hydratase [Candidatus Magasanikbacteria bacterium]|nr:phosphopyruvate hydratase [Candidatus Magasanikbacteria bacterium]
MVAQSIKQIIAREILDSRGNPSLRTWVILQDGSKAEAAVPSGASTGTHEALELRDGARRYNGKGVLKAVKNVNTLIRKALAGVDASKQRDIDKVMLALDGTPNKSKLGANAILSVSLACARAAAESKGQPLYKHIRQTFGLSYKSWRMPVPTMNILNGGRHADNGLSIQEFMIVPINRRFSERVRMGAEVFQALHRILRSKGFATGVGDEGGFAPELTNNEQALRYIVQAIRKADYAPGKQVMIAMDWAASEFHRKGKYYFADAKSAIDSDHIISILETWIKKYPIISVEDPLDEDDWEAWQKCTKQVKGKIHIVGDDLLVTNTERIKKAIEMNVATAVLIKVNQIGSLSETIDAISLAQKHKYAISVSHRSGETSDTFISDLSVAVNAEFIKTGSLSRSERVEKYNRLMEIEDELGF